MILPLFHTAFAGALLVVEHPCSFTEQYLVAKFTDRTFAEYVRIVDLNGREVYRNEIYTSGELVIETALESGIYFVELLSESKLIAKK